uniref:Uncharacterized protein n=1 Tax=viral metagenome TaxID=1070528 RepID=A0A6C0EPL3_9ZZZZ
MNDNDVTEKITKSISQFLYKTNIYSKARISTFAICSIALFCGINLCITLFVNNKLNESKKDNNRLNDIIRNIDNNVFSHNIEVMKLYKYSLRALNPKIIYDTYNIKNEIQNLDKKLDTLLDAINHKHRDNFSFIIEDNPLQENAAHFVSSVNECADYNEISTNDLECNELDYNKIVSEDDECYDINELLSECYDNIPCNNSKKITGLLHFL